MTKKHLISLAAAVVLAALTAGSPVAGAYSSANNSKATAPAVSLKEESIYGILASDGSIRTVYVVNTFPDGGQITDYGNYSDVKNLTGTEEVRRDGDLTQITDGDTAVRYQGTMQDATLPWNISIEYKLDNQPTTADQLAGATGALSMRIRIVKNPEADPFFFEHYALQATVALPAAKSSNVVAPGATAIDAGGKRQLVYTILPGKGADIEITADVKDFEMDAISLNGIRLNLDFDVDTTAFTEQLTELKDAVTKLDDGAQELSDGADKLSTGLDTFADGLGQFSDGLALVPGGAGEIKTGVVSISDGLAALSTQGTMLNTGAEAIEKATFDQINAQIAQLGLGLPVLDRTNYAAVLGSIPDLAPMLTTLTQTVQFTDGVKAYTAGVTQIQEGAATLGDGVGQLETSLTTIATSATGLSEAADTLNESLATLADGIAEYAEGTGTFSEETGDLDQNAQDTIDELLVSMTGGDASPVSFVSAKNTEVLSVQFLLKTDAIQIVEIQEEVPVEVELTFWDRLLGLFSIG